VAGLLKGTRISDSVTLGVLTTVPPGLAPKCVKTTKTGASWMGRSHHIWWAGARADRTAVPFEPSELVAAPLAAPPLLACDDAVPAILNLHERIENKLFLNRTRKDSNFKRPHICATLFQIEKC
jgi:hypothetical protein